MSTNFLDWILDAIWTLEGWFRGAYDLVDGWVYPFNLLAVYFFRLANATRDFAISFAYFGFWVIEVTDRIVGMLTYDNVFYYLSDFIAAANNAWDWVEHYFINVWDVIDTWWLTTGDIVTNAINLVRDWTIDRLDTFETILNTMQATIDNLSFDFPDVTLILDWFGNWWSNILLNLDNWWAGKLLDIQSLINTAFLLRESYWLGWQEIRSDFTDFFADPLQWFYDKLDDFFERFW